MLNRNAAKTLPPCKDIWQMFRFKMQQDPPRVASDGKSLVKCTAAPCVLHIYAPADGAFSFSKVGGDI